MSEAPDLTEDEAFAAEHALGVLNARERADAEARMAREPAFAADVEAWRARLSPMLESVASVPAPQGLWSRIERMLPANDNGAIMNKLRFWRNSAMGGFALAAASLAAVLVQVSAPPVVVTREVPGVVARLDGDPHVLEHRRAGQDVRDLVRARDRLPRDPVGREPGDVLALEDDAPGGRPEHAGDAVEERGLAAGRLPDDADEHG